MLFPFSKMLIRLLVIFAIAGSFLILVWRLNSLSRERTVAIETANYSPIVATDSIALPPVRQEFFSLDKDYVFVVSTSDNWKTNKAKGELFQITGGNRKPLWTINLPHEYGPRYVLVGSKGQVLLLDEWINVKSRYAIMILDRDNHLVAQYDFDTVQKILDVPIADIVDMAEGGGWWVTSPPILDPTGESARIETAGKILIVRLSDGHLFL